MGMGLSAFCFMESSSPRDPADLVSDEHRICAARCQDVLRIEDVLFKLYLLRFFQWGQAQASPGCSPDADNDLLDGIRIMSCILDAFLTTTVCFVPLIQVSLDRK